MLLLDIRTSKAENSELCPFVYFEVVVVASVTLQILAL